GIPSSFGVGWAGNLGEQAGDYFVRIHAFGFGVEVGEDAVAEDRRGDGFYVLGHGVGPAIQRGAGFGAEDQVLRSARAGAPTYPLADEVRRFRLVRASRTAQRHRIPEDVVASGNSSNDLLKVQDLLLVQRLVHLDVIRRS